MKSIRPSTEAAIIEAAFELLNQNPKASLAQIAAHAGVGRATLHRHFSGRDDLIKTMAIQAINETEVAADSASQHSDSYSDALERIFKAIIPLGNRHWFLAQEQGQNDEKISRKIKQQNQTLYKVVNHAKNEGLFNPHIPSSWIMQTYDHMIHAAWVMIRTEQSTVAQATELAWNTLINGLAE
ncbi:MAG: TetR/AcrR family transcriptional regulator [Marinicella sp.]